MLLKHPTQHVRDLFPKMWNKVYLKLKYWKISVFIKTSGPFIWIVRSGQVISGCWCVFCSLYKVLIRMLYMAYYKVDRWWQIWKILTIAIMELLRFSTYHILMCKPHLLSCTFTSLSPHQDASMCYKIMSVLGCFHKFDAISVRQTWGQQRQPASKFLLPSRTAVHISRGLPTLST